MARYSSPHWRDPMHYAFLVAALTARGATLCMRHAGPGFVALGMGLIVVVGALFMYIIVPVMADTMLQLVLHASVSVFLLFNIYFNYALCIATDPGTILPKQFGPDDSDEDSDEDDAEGDGRETGGLLPRIRPSASMAPVNLADPQSILVTMQRRIYRAGAAGSTTYCRRCRIFRPVRAHHCSVCDKCIDQMDHHCPWVNNCIGRYNYRYFVCFLVWLAVGCYYACFTSFTPAYGELNQLQYDKLVSLMATPLFRWLNANPVSLLQFAFGVSCSAGIAVSILGGWHCYLIATAQTSVELQINRSPRNRRLHGGRVVSPYTTGTIHGNWELVFGKCRFKLLSLLPSTQLPPEDEYRRPHRGQAKVSAADSGAEHVNTSSMEEIV